MSAHLPLLDGRELLAAELVHPLHGELVDGIHEVQDLDALLGQVSKEGRHELLAVELAHLLPWALRLRQDEGSLTSTAEMPLVSQTP